MPEETRSRPPGDGPPSGAGGDACLVFVEGDAVLGLRVPLEREVELGRDAACAVRLPSDDVSRRHARIAADAEGHLVVDLGSTNGTWVNGRRVELHRLRAGDRLRVGAFVARYVAAGDPEGGELAGLALASRRDALTGLPNRRAFEEELAREAARAARSGAPLSVAILDVDRFKAVNDTLGHEAGDNVLRAVARFLARHVREADYVFRWGGDEFIVLISCDEREAVRKSEELRHAFAVSEEIGAIAPAIGLSIGCVQVPPDTRDIMPLVQTADERMYLDKKKRRR